MPATEINYDGLVGPTHHYGGLSPGNLASQRHAHQASRPRQAAIEGLDKARFLRSLGVAQAIIPPQHRPDIDTLRRVGFTGRDHEVLANARREDRSLLACAASASAMWAANAATVSPGADTHDGRVHFTPANLVSQFHRSLEAPATARTLRALFPDDAHFAHHLPLPASMRFRDEGAANHTRLTGAVGEPGVELFVFGRDIDDRTSHRPRRFPARQTLDASRAVARAHGLHPQRTLFAQQNPAAIDAGAFHNDVVAVGHEHVMLYHEHAFVETPTLTTQLRSAYRRLTQRDPLLIEVPHAEVSLPDAIGSYLFNSQLVTLPDGAMALVCPAECRERPLTHRYLERLEARGDNPIAQVHFVRVRQSMENGGGPACLRLRVVLTDEQRAAAHQGVMLTDELDGKLRAWVERHYREHLSPDDLADPRLLEESRQALDELTTLLDLPGLYDFQR
ncbi:MAG: N-succinylarginine dihydrolase [Phycisphaeraceae bacterium]